MKASPSTMERTTSESVDAVAVAWRDRARQLTAEPWGTAFAVAIGMLVVVYVPFMADRFWTPRTFVLLLLVPVGLVLLARRVVTADPPARWLAAFLVAAFASSLLSHAPVLSLLGAHSAYESWLFVAAGAACWAIGRHVSLRSTRSLEVAFIAACAISALVGFVQLVSGLDHHWLGMFSGARVRGLSGNPVYFGAFMAGAAALFAKRHVDGRDHGDLGAFGLFAVFVALSGSRVVLVGVALITVSLIATTRRRRSVELVPTLVVSYVVASVLQRLFVPDGRTITDRLETGGGLDVRFGLWDAALRAFRERPLLGHGPGRVRGATQRHWTPEFVREYASDFGARWEDVHNIGIQYLASFGIVGGALLVALAVSSRRLVSGPLAWASLGIATSWLLQPSRLMTLQVAAALLGAAYVRRDETERPSRASPVTAVAGVVGVALAGTFLLGQQLLERGNERRSAADIDRATDIFSWDPTVADAERGIALEPDSGGTDEQRLARALEIAERITTLEPDYPVWWTQYAGLQLAVGDVAGARASVEAALELQEHQPRAIELLHVIAEETGDDALAAEAVARWELIYPDDPEGPGR